MKVYVGNLVNDVVDADLEELFSQHGEVKSVNIIKDKISGEPKGFGFVEYATSEQAQTAIEQLNGHELKGKAIKVAQAKSKSSRPSRGGGFGNRRGGFGGGNRGGGGGGGGFGNRRGGDRRGGGGGRSSGNRGGGGNRY